MGTPLDAEELREEVEARELSYKKTIRSDTISKFKHVCMDILPSLMNAVFDPTVRNITLNIVRPCETVITNNCTESKRGKLTVHSDDMLQKAIYFEELYKTWDV